MSFKDFVGFALCLAAIVVGLYMGIWWAFIGGIVDVINQIKAEEVSAIGVAVGIAKVFFSGLIGWLSFVLLFIPGQAMLK